MKRTLWLRHETKPFEERVALTPMLAGELVKRGHEVIVEKSPVRAFSDEEYVKEGCLLRETNSWITDAPLDATIFGLKELEAESFPLKHRHIHFAHVYKNQEGARDFLARLYRGGGKLFDLEYLVDEKGKRVSAFGVWAGFTGAALGLDLWIAKELNLDINKREALSSFSSSRELTQMMASRMADLGGRKPRVLIIGAKGRCGKGARQFFDSVGIEAIGWTRKETQGRSHIEELLDFDLIVNCVLMTKKAKPWLTLDMLDGNQKLSVLSDVSCEPTGPCNPVPVYPRATTMDKPAYYVPGKNLAVTAIDHLPSLLPKESSEDFSSQLFPHLVNYMDGELDGTPWSRALTLFYKKVFTYFPEEDLSEPLDTELDSFNIS